MKIPLPASLTYSLQTSRAHLNFLDTFYQTLAICLTAATPY